MKRHISTGVLLYLTAYGLGWAQPPLPAAPLPFTFDQRFHIYLKQTYRVSSILGPAVFPELTKLKTLRGNGVRVALLTENAWLRFMVSFRETMPAYSPSEPCCMKTHAMLPLGCE